MKIHCGTCKYERVYDDGEMGVVYCERHKYKSGRSCHGTPDKWEAKEVVFIKEEEFAV